MKISLRLFALLLVTLLSLQSYGYDFAMGPLTYTILSEDDATVEVARPASDDIKKAAIPQKVVFNKKSYTVAGIGYGAFCECKELAEVTIPNSVTTISASAFAQCQSLTSIVLPNSVKNLGNTIFFGCKNLTNVTLPSGLTAIGDSDFYDCTSLENIELPTTLQQIGQKAFAYTPLTSLELPAALSNIGAQAFYSCDSLTSITVSHITTPVTSMPESESDNIIADGAFEECSSLVSVEIPGTVKTLGEYAFSKCEKLESIKIPDSVNEIGQSCFYHCTSLKNINLPESLTTIGDFAFIYCFNINSIQLPASIQNIGIGIFENCTSLSNITVDSANQYFTTIDDVLYNKSVTKLLACPSTKYKVTVPETVEEIANCAFSYCTGLMSITLPSTLRTIGKQAFYCTGIGDVNIPKSVDSIGVSAFGFCNNMSNIYVDSANDNFSSLDGILYNKHLTRVLECPTRKTEAVLPATVEIIDESAFSQCRNLKTIDIPESIKVIGSEAFFSCSSLERITLPKSVNEIGDAAFMYCNALSAFQIKRVTPLECGYIFGPETLYNATLYVPIGTKGAYSTVWPWHEFPNIVETDFAGVETPTAEKTEDLRIGVNGDTATIEGVEDGEEIAIYDMSGRLIRTGKEHTFAGLARGIYVVKAGAKTAKFTM